MPRSKCHVTSTGRFFEGIFVNSPEAEGQSLLLRSEGNRPDLFWDLRKPKRSDWTRKSGNDDGAVTDSSGLERQFLLRAVELAGSSMGRTAPHPYSGCVIARNGRIVGEGCLYAQGTRCAEVQAVEEAGELAKGAVAYLNLEPGDCHGDDSAVRALCQAGVAEVVIGMRNPLEHQWGRAISSMREAGLQVSVLGEGARGGSNYEDLICACREVNASLLYRAVHRVPFSILKYAMTLDGKIAASTGHAAWVTSKLARQRVFETRAQSDAVIVGGNTVRRDDPRLTTRQEGGHVPVRIVMSRTLRLPENARLWDVSCAPTIVMTQRGVREDFQSFLKNKGVEVVEFDFLTPHSVMEYCAQRGFLQVLWECGGTLSAPAITSGSIHKVMAFVAPKIIGGVTAPSPVGELGFVEMTQALNLTKIAFEQVGPDLLVTGFLYPLPDPRPVMPTALSTGTHDIEGTVGFGGPPILSFYKAWDCYGVFSNFSPHPIRMSVADSPSTSLLWQSVEHYYQAQKFSGSTDTVALGTVNAIRSARSPEEAARLGRRLERERPDLVGPLWATAKVGVMYAALRCKFCTHPTARALLLSTRGSVLVESSPHDYFWGSGRTGKGQNHLGQLLMQLREELWMEESVGQSNCSMEIGTARAVV